MFVVLVVVNNLGGLFWVIDIGEVGLVNVGFIGEVLYKIFRFVKFF